MVNTRSSTSSLFGAPTTSGSVTPRPRVGSTASLASSHHRVLRSRVEKPGSRAGTPLNRELLQGLPMPVRQQQRPSPSIRDTSLAASNRSIGSGSGSGRVRRGVSDDSTISALTGVSSNRNTPVRQVMVRCTETLTAGLEDMKNIAGEIKGRNLSWGKNPIEIEEMRVLLGDLELLRKKVIKVENYVKETYNVSI